MDLVLLKPGLDELEGASLIDGTVVDTGEDLTGCIELHAIFSLSNFQGSIQLG